MIKSIFRGRSHKSLTFRAKMENFIIFGPAIYATLLNNAYAFQNISCFQAMRVQN